MNSNRRRNFRSRPQKNNFRRRSISATHNGSSNLNSFTRDVDSHTDGSSNLNGNGNLNFNRNLSMNNIHNVEKTMQKYQQLAKDAQSNGDPVLSQNYLQHADHYLRRYNELNERESFTDKPISAENLYQKRKYRD